MANQAQLEQRRLDLIKVMKQKDDIEKAIIDITEYLDAPGMPGVKGKLVDDEGFPLADVDLFEIRKMRNRLACLQTDHGAIMKQIEQGLFSLHEDYKNEEVKEGDTTMQINTMTTGKFEDKSQASSGSKGGISSQELKIPFAWISDVIEGSPSDQAGLKKGDAIYKFGPIDSTNHENLNAIVELVKKNINEVITLRLLRKNLIGANEDKTVEFIPKEWGGRGYLGCALKLNPI